MEAGALAEAALANAEATRVALLSLAAQCEGPLITRLDDNDVAVGSRTGADVSAIMSAVGECVRAFSANARRSHRAEDKHFEMACEDLDDAVKILVAFLSQISTGNAGCEALVDTADAIDRVVRGLPDSTLSSTSALISSTSCDDALVHVSKASQVQLGIDPARCSFAHAPWLARGGLNRVTLAVRDANSDPLYGVLASHVAASVADAVVGWAVSLMSVEADTVSFGVFLSVECVDVAVLDVNIAGTQVSTPLKVIVCVSVLFESPRGSLLFSRSLLQASAPAAAVEEAKAACERAAAIEWDYVSADVLPMVTACKAALSSPEVAALFLDTVSTICGDFQFFRLANKRACAEAGVIPVIVSFMHAHSAVDVSIAVKGCAAFLCLVSDHIPNAHAIATSAEALGAILSAMALFPANADVQEPACNALMLLIVASSHSSAARAGIRGSRAVELLTAAKVNHPEEGNGKVSHWANSALDNLSARY